MHRIIYVDVLVGVNLFVNYFILLATGKFLNSNLRRWRLVLGGLLGGISSLTIFLPDYGIVISLLMKLVISVVLVAVSFRLESLLHFCKLLAVFFSVTFGFGGLVFLIWMATHSQSVMVNNGVVYFDISPMYLLISAVVSYIVMRGINRLTGRGKPKDIFTEVEIVIEGISIKAEGKLDTGNSLREPFSGYPVVVVSQRFLLNALPIDIAVLIHKKVECFTAQTVPADSGWDSRFRLIPYESVGGRGMMCGMKPDWVRAGERRRENVYLAISQNDVSADGYAILLHPELLD